MTEQNKEKAKSAHGFYHFIRKAWKKPDKETQRIRMIEWRAGKRIVKLERPTRLDRARSIGYKAKKGFIVLRVALKRGGRSRSRIGAKRKTKKQTSKKTLKMNYQWIAEQRAQKRFSNLEVLNSYNIGKDGTHYFFEVIMVDPERPEIKNDKQINWICNPKNRHRALRGLTSAARKSRGLRSKSPNLKVRPSRRAWDRKGK